MSTKKTLLERQCANLEAQQTSLRESISRKVGMDASKLDALMESDNFTWKKLRENLNSNSAKLREATSESAFGQLLRYGVQNFMFDAYKDVNDFVYTELVQAVPSSNRQEWYAPLFGVEIPKDVPTGGQFEDSKISGLDVEVVNKKIGRMFTVERELIDDDQTGQVQRRAQTLGSRLRYKEEADVMGVDVGNLIPTQRAMPGITGIAGVSYTAAIGNKASDGFHKLSQTALENADIALMNITDPLGNRIFVKPSLLLTNPAEKFNAAKLLNSALQPSVPNTATFGSGATQTSFFQGGSTGWNATTNPLQGLYTLKISRFLPTGTDTGGQTAGYWYLMEPKTSITWQDRDPLELTMEARDSGRSFERDEYRWKIRRRYATAVIEFRFLFCGMGI